MPKFITQLVETKKNGAQFWAGYHLSGRVTVYALDILQRDRIDPINIAGQECSDTGGVVRNGSENHLIEIVLRLVPPVRIWLKHRPHTSLVFRNDEWPGAIGM